MILFLLKYYLEAKLFLILPERQIRKIHIKRFRKIFEWARKHSEFYKTVYTEAGVMDLKIETEEDILKVPVVDKTMMKNFDVDSLLTCKKTDKLAINRTSGSNGVPFAVYSTKQEHFTGYVRSFMALKNYNPFKKFCLIGVYEDKERIEKGSFLHFLQRRFGIFERETYSVLTKTHSIIDKLLQKDIDILSSTPTCLQVIADELKKRNVKLNIPYVVASGETLTNDARQQIKNYFNAKIIDVYGCMELPSLAWTKPMKGTYNYSLNALLPEYINPINIDGEEYNDFVFTNFINRTMPFIRYRVGDKIKTSNSYSKLGQIKGRADDILELFNGQKIHVVQLYVFSLIKGLAQYKFFQQKDGTIFFYAVCDSSCNKPKLKQDIEKTWEEYFGPHPFIVEFRNELALQTKSGKFKRVERESSENGSVFRAKHNMH